MPATTPALKQSKQCSGSGHSLARSVAPFIMDGMKLGSRIHSAFGHSVFGLRFSISVGAALVLACCVGGVVRAIDAVQLDVEQIAGEGWSAQGISFNFALPGRQGAVLATIDEVRLARSQTLRTVRIACPAVELNAQSIACANAQVVATLPAVGAQTLIGRVVYDRNSGDVDFDVRGERLVGGVVRVRASLRDQGWRVHANLERIELEQVLKLVAALELPTLDVVGTGHVTAELKASGATELGAAEIVATIAALTANNETGTLASDALSLTTTAKLSAARGGWDFSAQVNAQQGQAYVQPIFVDFGGHALALDGEGHIAADGAIELRHFALDHRDVLQARGSARFELNHAQPVRELRLDLQALQFPGAYQSYLQPFLLDTDFKSLTTTGRIEGEIEVAAGAPQRIDLQLRGVSLDDGAQKFVLQNVRGDVSWREGVEADEDSVLRAGTQRSQLRWDGGRLLSLALGPSELVFTAIGQQFRLLEPAHIPLLDGAIDLESFRIRNLGSPSIAFMVDATIRPISVSELCRAFGWPEFGGSVGGTISKLRLREGVVTLGTTLQAEVFDGRVAISDLRLEDALGNWPRFYSSIHLDNLDLELLTSTFSFGRITGRLSGAIKELQLFNWEPIAFEASLFTPPNDRSRRRISQRAVENIGSIGGGGAGITQALSSGVMRFFDDFRYDRLGLSCRLVNEVCYMDGVEPAPNGGYYLVKGSGLPRINVIGNSRRVDWPRLVQQLIAVTESAGPVVE